MDSPLSKKQKSTSCNTPSSATASPSNSEFSEIDVTGNEKFFDIVNSPLVAPIKSKKSATPNKVKCPCGKSDKTSTYITCSICKQCWHNKCCNCVDLDQETIRKLSRWECPACYVCPALGKLPASLYVEIHSMRSTLSALTLRESQNSMHLKK